MNERSTPIDDRMTSASRMLFLIAGVLVVLAGFSLFVLTEHTDRFFAWTINPPVTAAFMGAAYWSAAILQFSAWRSSSWNRAAAVLPGIVTFTVLTLIATLIHVDRFHLDNPLGWIWIGIYVLFPVAALLVIRRHGRPGRIQPGPGGQMPEGLRVLSLIQSAVLIPTGIALFLVPAIAESIWSWELTPLTARAVAAWLIGMGVTAAFEAWQRDGELARLLGLGKLVLVLLVAMAVGRYSGDVNLGSTQFAVGIIFCALLLTDGALSTFGLPPAPASPGRAGP